MAQQIINVGASPNDGLGDPIRTSFIKCNDNFSQLYSRAQTTPPGSAIGNPGDQAGMYAYDSTYFYYCYANYNGSTPIWAQVTQVGNISVSSIQNGTSNVKIADVNGVAIISIGGTSNVAVFSAQGELVNGSISATGNVYGQYLVGDGSQLTNLPASYGNGNVAAFLPVYSGDILAANISANTVSTTGNITGAYILGNGSQLSGLPQQYSNANVTAFLSNSFGSNSISTTGNISAGNVRIANSISISVVSATGNISTTGNLNAQGIVSATGNIVTAGYFVGNFLGNVTGNIVVPGSNTQVLFNTNGNVNAVGGFTFNTDGPNLLTVLGTISSQGNVVAGNVVTSGQVSAGGNIQASNLLTAGVVSATGNVRGGNINTVGLITATGNIIGNYIFGNGSQLSGLPQQYSNANVSAFLSAFGSNTISTSGNITAGNIDGVNNVLGGNVLANNIGAISFVGNVISVSGNITSGNITTGNISIGYLNANSDLNVGGNVSANAYTGISLSVTSNITGGNLKTVGTISASGNITGNYILGNGSQLSGLPQQYSNANVTAFLASFGSNTISTTGQVTAGNINVTNNMSAGVYTGSVLSVTGSVSGGNVYSGNNITAGATISATGNITGNNILTGGLVSANTISGNILTGNTVSATGNVNAGFVNSGGLSLTGNILGPVYVSNSISATSLSVGIGTITVGNIVTPGNTVANIGSINNQFNTIFAQATSAQYADLAEIYVTDAEYSPGTVVVFGGEQEITTTTEFANVGVAGVISSNPAYLMNSSESGLPVALRGRVPVNVVGPVYKGDLLVTAGDNPGYAVSVGKSNEHPLAVFAKSIETNTNEGVKVIAAVIL